MGKLSSMLILLVKTGTETNAKSRTGTMTHQKCIFGELLYFWIIYSFLIIMSYGFHMFPLGY